jgi:hypothetical protein
MSNFNYRPVEEPASCANCTYKLTIEEQDPDAGISLRMWCGN